MGLDSELAGRVRRLDLAAKVRLLTGSGFWTTHGDPSIGLAPMVLSDGPAGVRGALIDERDPSASFPAPIALAASFDAGLVGRIGGLLGAEARRKGVHVLLAPTVNIVRTPRGGRTFECFGEEPEVASALGVAYIRGVQEQAVAATVKHYVANDSETDRFTVDVQVDPATLHEVYLAPFDAAVHTGGAWALMSAYNSVGGRTMTEHRALQRDLLKDNWGFDGLVVSDWTAARSTEAAALGGLDLVMPGPHGPWGDALVAAVRDGRVPESEIDDKVLRLLRLAARVGALDGVPVGDLPPLTAPDELRADLRDAGARSVVLLRNEAVDGVPVLPLQVVAEQPLRRIAVLGALAEEARFQGGGSASVVPAVSVSPLDGLRAAFGGDAEVVYARGGAVRESLPPVGAGSVLAHDPDSGEPGMRITYFDDAGAVLLDEVRRVGRVTSLEPPPALQGATLARSRVRAVLTARQAGPHELGVSGLGEVKVRVDGEEVLTGSMTFGADPVQAIFGAAGPRTTVELDPERPVTVEVDHVPLGVGWGSTPTMFIVGLHAAPVGPGVDAELDAAVELAAGADAAVVVVGTTEDVETEGVDRADLDLPGRQNELVGRVAAVNRRTVAVVISGGPVLLPWRAEVPAVVAAGYLGQESGAALADVLTGRVEPTARLPLTWPDHAEDVIDPTPADGRLHYTEGVHVGHRGYRERDAEPAYWFGAGRGWTTWAYADLAVADELTAQVTVRNTGGRPGTELVQVYALYADESVPRFAGAARVRAGAGEEAVAEVTVPPRVLLRYDGKRMAPRPGPVVLLAGPNAGDLPLRAVLP